jgi:hypothetical protein
MDNSIQIGIEPVIWNIARDHPFYMQIEIGLPEFNLRKTFMGGNIVMSEVVLNIIEQ